MSKPVIGIVCAVGPDPIEPSEREVYFVGKPYVDRVLEAGGMPVLVPHHVPVRDLLDLIDGWLIIGGHDIDPAIYGHTAHPQTVVEPVARFEQEKSVFESAHKDMPVLGICYGCQFLNVVHGGDLVQHLPDVVGHGLHSGGTSEDYEIEPESRTSKALGTKRVTGKSYHHQAVGHVGKGLRVVGRAEDGTVEALESESDRWIVGVQWHPERTPEDEASRRLFRTFVERAEAFRKGKQSCGTW